MKGLVLALLIASTTTASARCWPDRDSMVEFLTGDKYQEQPLMTGDTKMYLRRGSVGFEFWGNFETGSYTYVFKNSNGHYCVGDFGSGLQVGEPIEVEPKEEGSSL